MYPKEFVLLCSDWLRGSEQDKSKFKKFQNIMLKDSFKTNGYRIWEFDKEEVKDVIFNEGDLEITPNPIESCFRVENNVDPYSGEMQIIEPYEFEAINKKLAMWVADVKIITRWERSIYFDIYKPLKYALKDYLDKGINSEYTQEEYNLIKARYEGYKHQKEILHLGEYDNISSGEVLYVLISKKSLEYYMDDKIEQELYGETNDYYMFYNDDSFRNAIKSHKFYDEFKDFGSLMGLR